MTTASPDFNQDRARLLARKFLGYGILIFFAFVFLYPFVLAFTSSFKSLPDIQQNPVALFPNPDFGGWTLDGIRRLSSDQINFPRWTFNSVVTTIAVVVGHVAFDTTAGYALARLKFPGRRLIFRGMIALLAIPGIVLLVPRFLVMNQLGILNSYTGMIVPLVFDIFGIFLMKQMFEGIPRELEEAAALDGASAWQTFRFVYAPLAAPGLIALTILSTQGVWNDFMHMLISTPSEPSLKTLTVGLAGITAAFGEAPPWNTMLAGSLIATIPIAIIFFVFQRYFVQGIAASGSKG